HRCAGPHHSRGRPDLACPQPRGDLRTRGAAAKAPAHLRRSGAGAEAAFDPRLAPRAGRLDRGGSLMRARNGIVGWVVGAVLCSALLALQGCGYNRIQGADEQVKAAWAEVGNQYQRRADLIPNLIATVKGAADFERQTLE